VIWLNEQALHLHKDCLKKKFKEQLLLNGDWGGDDSLSITFKSLLYEVGERVNFLVSKSYKLRSIAYKVGQGGRSMIGGWLRGLGGSGQLRYARTCDDLDPDILEEKIKLLYADEWEVDALYGDSSELKEFFNLSGWDTWREDLIWMRDNRPIWFYSVVTKMLHSAFRLQTGYLSMPLPEYQRSYHNTTNDVGWDIMLDVDTKFRNHYGLDNSWILTAEQSCEFWMICVHGYYKRLFDHTRTRRLHDWDYEPFYTTEYH
jgi:hypothetical protein